jgi:hypothetical protein
MRRETLQSFRVPLQLGLSSLRNSIASSLALWVAIGILGLSLYFFMHGMEFIEGDVSGEVDYRITHLGNFVLGILLGGAGILGIAAAGIWATDAKAGRPSDIVLEPTGLRIDGDGEDELIAWPSIQESFVEPVAAAQASGATDDDGGATDDDAADADAGATSSSSAEGQGGNHRLALRLRDGTERALGWGGSSREIESLRLLSESINALCDDTSDTTPASLRSDPAVFRCCHCGAGLAPRDASTVSCSRCGTSNPVPEPLLARLRGPAELARGLSAERQIKRLLRQPGAAYARFFLFVFRWVVYLVWPLALVGWAILEWRYSRARSGLDIVVVDGHTEPYLWQALTTFGFAATVVAVLGLFVASLLANRRALSLVSLQLGAVPPARPGEPYVCRGCGAPLPERPDRVLIACLYCRVENVTGCDLVRAVQRTTAHEHSVTDALRYRRRARLRLLAALLVAPFPLRAVAQEVAEIAHWAPAAGSSREIALGRADRARAVVENLDWRHRSATLHDGAEPLTVTIPASATVLVFCWETECTLEVGESSQVLDRRKRSLVIQRGRLQKAPLDATE